MTIEVEGSDPISGGFVAGLPPHMVGAAESPDCTNTDPADPWGMTTRKASAVYTLQASTQNSGMTTGDVFIHPTTDQVIVRGASIIMFANKDGGFASIPGSGVSLATIMGVATLNLPAASVASGPQSLIVTDATIPILWNPVTGSVANASFASAGVIVSFAEIFANRAWVGGRRDGFFENYINHSALNNITDWTTASDAGAFQVGDAAAIKGLRACRNVLYVFKAQSIWAITGTSPLDFEVENVTRNIGLVSSRGTATDGQGVYFASDDGIYYINGLNISRVSDKVRQEYLDIPLKSRIVLAYKGEKLYCFRNSSSTGANDSALVACPRRKLETGETQAFWSKWASQYIGGADTGGTQNKLVGVSVFSSFQVFSLDYASVTGNIPSAVPSITLTYNTPDMDFGYPDAVKNLVRWTTHHKPSNATQTWTGQWFVNGASTGTAQTWTIGSMGAGSVSHDGTNKAGGAQISGEFLRLKLSCIGQVTLYGYEVYAEPQVSEDFPRV